MFQFQVVIGLVLFAYGYSITKNPAAWGQQGKEKIKPENWDMYVMQNARTTIFGGLVLMAMGAVDALFNLPTWLYVLLYLVGLGAAVFPLCRWMKTHEDSWWPWPKMETEKQRRKREAKEAARKDK